MTTHWDRAADWAWHTMEPDDGGSQTIRLDKELGLRASALAIDDIGDELTSECS